MSQISGAVPTPEIRGCSLENMKSAQGNKQVLCHSPSLHFTVSLYVGQTLGSLPKQQYLNICLRLRKRPSRPTSDLFPISCHWIQDEPKPNLLNKLPLFM